jgi:hypothetical protein
VSEILVCQQCGCEREVLLEEAEGLPLTVAEYRSLLAITGHAVVCDRCVRADEEPA